MNKTGRYTIPIGRSVPRRCGKSCLLAAAVLIVASVPLFTSWMPLPSDSPSPYRIYPGNHAFIHKTGQHSAYGWDAHFRIHRPGYMVSGLQNGGESLPIGTYRYDFYFALRPGHLASLLSSANDVVRLEVADASTKDVLLTRTFQTVDFPNLRKKLAVKSVTFSTWGRAGHLFEPRVYW